MRLVLMLLVLANLGAFAWLHWYGGDPADELPAGRVDTELGDGLVLVSELQDNAATQALPLADEAPPPARQGEAEAPADQDAVSDDADSEVAAVPAAAPTRCATIGPFDQLDVAQFARQRLAELAINAQVRESGGQIRAGFWVYLPPLASRNAAKQIEAELRERGVRDLFIVTGSEQRNAISLGLFSTPDRADQRAAEIGRLGYTPRVAERFRDATVYWVDFRESDEEPLEPESVGVAAAGDAVPEKREIPCDTIANGGGGA